MDKQKLNKIIREELQKEYDQVGNWQTSGNEQFLDEAYILFQNFNSALEQLFEDYSDVDISKDPNSKYLVQMLFSIESGLDEFQRKFMKRGISNKRAEI